MNYKFSFKVLLFLFALIIISHCSSYGRKFEKEFDEYVSDSDKVLTDGDYLHPAYAFIKNGKLKGLEFNSNPECGRYTKRYFLSENDEIFKIIIEKDFFNESCGDTFDSIYVMNPTKKEILTYTNFAKGKKIKRNILEEELKVFDKYKKEICNWKSK